MSILLVVREGDTVATYGMKDHYFGHNLDKGIYSTTYENSQITGVDMNKEDLKAENLVIYPLVIGQQINFQN